jgi:hypothetical protein
LSIFLGQQNVLLGQQQTFQTPRVSLSNFLLRLWCAAIENMPKQVKKKLDSVTHDDAIS